MAAGLDPRLIEPHVARLARAQGREILVAGETRQQDTDDLLKTMVYVALRVTDQHRPHERHGMLRRARDDAREEVVGYTERLGLFHEFAQLGIGNGLARQCSNTCHSAASEELSDAGAAP